MVTKVTADRREMKANNVYSSFMGCRCGLFSYRIIFSYWI